MHCSTILMLYIIVYLPRAIHCSCQQVVLPKIGNDAWCPTKDNLSKLEKRHRLLRFRYSSHDSFSRAGIFIQWICSGVDERDLQEVGRARCIAIGRMRTDIVRCGRINIACAIDSNTIIPVYRVR